MRLRLTPERAAVLCMALAALESDPYPYRTTDADERLAEELGDDIRQVFGGDERFRSILRAQRR